MGATDITSIVTFGPEQPNSSVRDALRKLHDECESRDAYSGDWNTIDGVLFQESLTEWEFRNFDLYERYKVIKGTAVGGYVLAPTGRASTITFVISQEKGEYRTHLSAEEILRNLKGNARGRELLQDGYRVIRSEIIESREVGKPKTVKVNDGGWLDQYARFHPTRESALTRGKKAYKVSATYELDNTNVKVRTKVKITLSKTDVDRTKHWVMGLACE